MTNINAIKNLVLICCHCYNNSVPQTCAAGAPYYLSLMIKILKPCCYITKKNV